MLRKNNLDVRSEIWGEQAMQKCTSFKKSLFHFIKDLDGLLREPKLIHDEEYLGRMARCVLEINDLSRNIGGCGEEMATVSQLVQNILTQIFKTKEVPYGTTLLRAAEAFEKRPGAEFGQAMAACVHHTKDTEALLTSLKIIAYDM